jgi:hypothetical protein
MTNKGFNNTLRPCYYIFSNFELGHSMIILFKLTKLFSEVFRFSFNIIIDGF